MIEKGWQQIGDLQRRPAALSVHDPPRGVETGRSVSSSGVLVVWRPGVLWTFFFAPGMAALNLMALLPARLAGRITYGIHPEGGASSAIPLVGVVSIVVWAGLMLAWWTRLSQVGLERV